MADIICQSDQILRAMIIRHHGHVYNADTEYVSAIERYYGCEIPGPATIILLLKRANLYKIALGFQPMVAASRNMAKIRMNERILRYARKKWMGHFLQRLSLKQISIKSIVTYVSLSLSWIGIAKLTYLILAPITQQDSLSFGDKYRERKRFRYRNVGSNELFYKVFK